VQAKVGDRVSFAAKKVGQPPRVGVVRTVTKGISGVRYSIKWEDGHESVMAPGAGTIVVDGKTKPKSKTKKAAGTKKSAKRKR
jgi:hypothetical protein